MTVRLLVYSSMCAVNFDVSTKFFCASAVLVIESEACPVCPTESTLLCPSPLESRGKARSVFCLLSSYVRIRMTLIPFKRFICRLVW